MMVTSQSSPVEESSKILARAIFNGQFDANLAESTQQGQTHAEQAP